MFVETRGNDGKRKESVEFSEAILNPSASFGGLYVPKSFPVVNQEWINGAKNMSYQKLTLAIMQLFFLDIDDEVMKEAISLYDNFDNDLNPVPLVKAGERLYVNELYHGPTRAFKDMALQPFGHILSHLAKEKNEQYLILAATSGDTGPATLETFKNKDNIRVVCLYPDGGTSDVQRLQMVTNDGKNEKVLGIFGNFDDAQRALKSLLASEKFKSTLDEKNIKLSAANSVNFGRIIFQIVYHFSAYLKLLSDRVIKEGEKIYLTIPSGNFGNALGAYYAKKMGLPIEKILIASNVNNILTDLITKGEYDIRERKFIKTTSPAMDILISSNVERMLFDKFGANRTKDLMNYLQKKGFYRLTKLEFDSIQEDFDACFCTDKFAKKTIKEFAENGYILDPHTATCIKARELEEKPLINVIASTAEWTKFAPTMYQSINESKKKISDEKALKELENLFHLRIPDSIKDLFTKEVIHNDLIDEMYIEDKIIDFLSE